MRRSLRWTLIAILTLAVIGIAGYSILMSDWFHEYSRQKVIALLERATGGKVDFARYELDLRRMRIKVEPFSLRGKELPTQAALFRADSLELGLKIVSLWKRDIDLLDFVAKKPEVHIYVDANGNTNLPDLGPSDPNRNAVEQLLEVAIDKIDLQDGFFEYDSRKIPLSLRVAGLRAVLNYEAAGPLYRGHLNTREVLLNQEKPITLSSDFVLEGNRARLQNLKLESNGSHVTGQAVITDFKEPKIEADYSATIALKDPRFKPITGGIAQLTGSAAYSEQASYATSGKATVSGLSVNHPEARLDNARGTFRYTLDPSRLRVTDAALYALSGSWKGSAEVADWRRFSIRGTADGIELNAIARMRGQEALPWNGRISGPLDVSGEIVKGEARNVKAQSAIRLQPVEGQIPVEGELNVSYEQAAGKVNLGSSYLKTKDSRLTFQGVLGERVDVALLTVNTKELEPLIHLAAGNNDFQLPVQLAQGEARFEGRVDGPLSDPVLTGRLNSRNVLYGERLFERVDADIRLSQRALSVANGLVAHADSRVTGGFNLALKDWKPDLDAPVQGFVASRRVDVERLLRDNKIDLPVKGILSAAVRVSGSMNNPQAEAQFRLDQAAFRDEKFNLVRGNILYTGNGSDKFSGRFMLDQASINISGDYAHKDGDWQNGELSMTLKAAGLDLAQSETIQALNVGLAGVLQADTKARLRVRNGRVGVLALDGESSVDQLVVRGQPVADFRLKADTKGDSVAIEGGATMGSGRLTTTATLGLTEEYPLRGSAVIPRTSLRLLGALAGYEGSAFPVRGFLQGRADFNVPLADPAKGSAEIVIDETRVRPRNTQVLDTQLDGDDLTVRNTGPVRFSIDGKGVRVQQAHFVAKDTDLSLEGALVFNSKAPLDLRLKGNIDLGVLSQFNPDMVTAGSSTINASLRGDTSDPELAGRMEIKNASFYFQDISNGIDKANGVILFDRNRATIEKLTGQTGGGTFDLNGFMSFSKEEIMYRLQAVLKQVRVRYPAGVSTSADADLTLAGSTKRSLLTGSVTVLRTGFVTNGDFSSMLADPLKPGVSAAQSNPFLQGMQFDVRIRTSANAVLQSSYTRELQVEADVRLRGSPAKPVVLGSLKANQGEIEFFGNRYTITRGEVLFFNTATIQPTLDIDVETRVRGVTAYINVNGPLDRLNINYRSEPPLQTSEIIALLTVGRAPSSAAGVPSSPTLQRTNILENTPNTLLGGALSSALTNRVERFFGASRIKIDPGVTGLEGISQARVTVEQSLSRDITVTFSTNLSRTQQQIITAEWDLSKEWAAVLTRDENGVFSVEFRLRKRF